MLPQVLHTARQLERSMFTTTAMQSIGSTDSSVLSVLFARTVHQYHTNEKIPYGMK